MQPAVSIVIPTYNEGDNIKTLVDGLFEAALQASISLEVVVVDDNSPDGTADVAGDLTSEYNVKVVRRHSKLGLSTAVIDGFKAASNDIVGVMDADLSHDPLVFPNVARPVVEGRSELSVGSRHVRGGAIENWSPKRKIVSAFAKLLAMPLTGINDPMSGFFFTRKSVVGRGALNPTGFKIMLEIIVKCSPRGVVEVPILFKDRRHGESKLNIGEHINYLRHLMRLYLFKLGLG